MRIERHWPEIVPAQFSRQRRAKFDAIETLRRIRRGVRPSERQRGRIGGEDVVPLREIGRSLNRVIRPALAVDADAELPPGG